MLFTYLIIGMIFVAFVIYSNDRLQNVISNSTDFIEVLSVVIVLAWHTIIWPIDILRAIITAFSEEET